MIGGYTKAAGAVIGGAGSAYGSLG